ncbi:hypothetical protein [Nocardia alba]|uniref:S-DNA-T family DNA segregation ATPase FtsK/SpoIIIE n=1 Tax=Nocardia alba TaxID=225051 RepID=A0A4R1FQN9_9NOCA|nr:hypothetical protein [Nocardia alba]TCJ94628.1 hypothetical protein DFR71_5231 [Nocardia alba]
MNTTTTTTTTHDPAGEILDAVLTAAGRLLLSVFTLAWWAILFPMVSVPAGIAVAAGWFFGWPAGVGVAGVAVAGMVLWRVSSPQTFERWFTGRVRSRFLAWFRYRRRWATMTAACGLSTRDGDRVFIPRLVSVEIGESLDIVRARMLPGHCPDTWTNRADHLAHGFGAQKAKVGFVGPGLVEITFRRSDSLADPVVVPFESMAGFKTIPSTRKAA